MNFQLLTHQLRMESLRDSMESACSMMAQAGLCEHYWAEAVATATYIRNRLPTRSLKNKTPHERWFDRKPDLSHVRVFGCMCYVYIPEVTKKEKCSKAEKPRFIGYTKGYHLFDERTSKILVCWDFIFNKSDFKYGSNKTKGTDEVTASHDQVVVPEDEKPTNEVQP